MKTRGLRWAIVFAAMALAILFAVRRLREGAAVPPDYVLASPAKVPAMVRALRPNYPYSVIPGGVYSAEELRHSMENDRAVREHYAGFDPQTARLVVSRTDRFEYASYRMNGRIFWTARKLRIPTGEVLIADGVHLARTRCGNRLSDIAVPHTSRKEPAADDLSLPPFSMDLVRPGLVTLAAPPLASSPRLPLTPPVPIAELPNGFGDGWPRAARFNPNFQIPPLHSPMFPGLWSPSEPLPPFGAFLTSGIPVAKNRPPVTTPSGTGTTGGGVAEVPEPSDLGLFGIFLFGTAWAFARLWRAAKR